MTFQVVTMLGEWPLSHKWVPTCVNSWRNLVGGPARIGIVSDGSLTKTTDFSSLGNCDFEFSTDQEDIILEKLSKYNHLTAMRKKDLTWRKILDTTLVYSHGQRILLIDTDVLIRKRVDAVPTDPGIYYLREDIPAYRGAPWLPFCEPMVLSFNAGFVLYCPSTIDLEFLDFCARRYFLKVRNYWWTEQAAWSLLAARVRERFYWDGRDARCISGFATRDSAQIAGNRVKFLSSNRRLSKDQILELAGQAAVLHLAGLGKHHWDVFSVHDTETCPMLRYVSDPILSFRQKLMVSARLGIKAFSA